MIVLDTSVLSVAYRRRSRRTAREANAVAALRWMIDADAPLSVPGIVVQELLSGVRHDAQFAMLEDLLKGFPTIVAERHHHVTAARIAHACRRAGVATSSIDCLIAAMAVEREAALFTLDEDFSRMAPHCALKLWRAAPEPRR